MTDYKIFQFSFGDGYAGSAKIAILSSELLRQKGHEVILFTTKNSLTEKRGKEKGLNITALDSSQNFKDLMQIIYSHFEDHKPDIVISHHSLDRKVGFKLKSKFGKKFLNIGYRHNITKSFPVIGPFLYNKYYDYLIACSQGVGSSLLASGIKGKKIKVIYNGINVPDNINSVSGNAIRSKNNLDSKIVLGLSTWFHKERKGFDILFKAFSNLDDRFLLLIVGIPENNKKEVWDYAVEFGIAAGKIFMPGYVDNIWEYYKAMDIFLLPSRSEGFSLALLEAAAAKIPIIASNIPGTNEFIKNGINGILFDLKKPEDLAAGIIRLSEDKIFSNAVAGKAHSLVLENYLIQNYGNNLDEFLRQVKREY